MSADTSRPPAEPPFRTAPKAGLRSRALRLLARREHSRLELTGKLAGPDTDPAELAALLDEFERRGWLSEQRLAEQQVARAGGRPRCWTSSSGAAGCPSSGSPSSRSRGRAGATDPGGCSATCAARA